MSFAVSIILLALALSLDGFGVGAMYGIRKIIIPPSSVAIIAGCSGTMMFVAMHVGLLLAHYIHPSTASKIGGIILIGIGCWSIKQMAMQRKDKGDAAEPKSGESEAAAANEEPRTLLKLELKRLGLMIEIVRRPSMADVDRSGIISPYEAALLGFSLSLDAFGAGIGAAMIGLSPFLTAIAVAAACGMFLSGGLRVGYLFADRKWMSSLSALPGCVLIVMGLFKLLK